MVVDYFNGFYFMYMFIAICLYLLLFFLLKDKSKKVKYNTLLFICFANLALHFAKLAFPPYRDCLPGSIRKVTFENICAVSTLVLPWVYLLKKSKVLNNYFFFISFVGGLGALLVPTEALGKSPFEFDVMRFYFCHTILCIVPALTASLDIYRPDYKKAWYIPFMFLAVEYVILINEIILIKVGFVESTVADFFDPDIRNSSFIFGPMSYFGDVTKIMTILVPKVFTQNIFNISGVGDFYWPVIWMLFPVMLYMPFLYLIFTLPFTFVDIKKDVKEKICNKA